MKISTMLYEKSCVDEASLALALKIARENILTELREWAEEEPTINGMMLKARLLARIDELINPSNL